MLMVIRWESLGTLVLMSVAIMGSPGPATISLVAAGAAYGLRRCLPYLVGIIAGTVMVLLAVATGITAVLLAIPTIRLVVVWVSAAYILWLAYSIATAPPLSERTVPSGAVSLSGGTFLGLANPKAWVAIAAVFASARLADATSADAVAKVAVLAGMIIAICATWLLASASIAPLLRDARRSRIVNVALAAAVLAATALAVFH